MSGEVDSFKPCS